MNTLPQTLGHMALVAALLLACIGFAGLARRRNWLDAEHARKFVHVTLGLTVTLFPILFEATWPVWMLAGLAVAALWALRTVPALRQRFGRSLHDVQRVSLGEFYFPIAAACTWQLFPGDVMRFSIPFAVLATADATAALVGSRYGRRRYMTLDGAKTWLGSLSFYATATLVTLLALLAFNDHLPVPLTWMQALMLAHLVGTLLMVVEALAWSGLDNLFIPVFGALLMDAQLSRDPGSMAIDAVVATALLVLCLGWRRRSTLTDPAVMGGALFAYIAFVVGGATWVLAPLSVFMTYAVLPPLRRHDRDRPHDIHALICATGAGLLWLIAHRICDQPMLLWPFVAAFAGQLACIGVAQLAFSRPHWSLLRVNLTAGALAALVVAVPHTLLMGAAQIPVTVILGTLCAAPLCAALFSVAQPQLRHVPNNAARWWRQGACPLVVSVLAYPWS